MTPDEIAGLLDQYRAGIEAELALLRQMADVAKDRGFIRGQQLGEPEEVTS